MSARAQYAPDLLEHLLLVGAQVDDAIADDDVGPAILHRHLLQQALPELDLIETHRAGRGARLGEHFRQHVDANHPSARSQLLCRDETIEAGARSCVDDFLSRHELPEREGIGDAGEGFDRRIGQAVDHGRIVAQALGQRPAGVEVVFAMRIDGDIAILALHLFSQRGRIDRQLGIHGSPSAC